MKIINYSLLKTIASNMDKFAIDTYLQSLTPVLNKNNKPIYSSGGMALVMKMKDSTGAIVAVKIWVNTPTKMIKDAYSKMTKTKILPDLMNYGDYYAEKLIFKDHKMDVFVSPWLTNFVSLLEYVDFHHQDIATLRTLANDIKNTFYQIRKKGLVHGDLHPENIRIGPGGHIKIIDLDCLHHITQLPCRDTIKGMPAFQHPVRSKATELQANTDDVAFLSILTCLYSYAEKVQNPNDIQLKSHLGITQHDLQGINQSKTIQLLRNSIGIKTKKYAQLLIQKIRKEYTNQEALWIKTPLDKQRDKMSLFFEEKAQAQEKENSHTFKKARKKIADYFRKNRQTQI